MRLKNVDRAYIHEFKYNQQYQTAIVWPCHEEGGRTNAEGCNEVKDEGRETERKTRQDSLDNIDSHLKGKTASLYEVLGTKCFEKRHDWRILIYRSTDRSSGKIIALLPGVW